MKKFYLKKTCGIYLITNTTNGMCYVGQSVDIIERWKAHSSSKKLSLIGIAINTEGISNFKFEVIEECTKEQLNEREKFWIEHYNCIHPLGYNKSAGGGGWTPHKMSDNVKEKISSGNKGKKRTEEHRQKYKDSWTEERRVQNGEMTKELNSKRDYCPLSEEQKRKIGESRRGRRHTEETIKKMKNRTFSEEHRQKLSEANRKRWKRVKELED